MESSKRRPTRQPRPGYEWVECSTCDGLGEIISHWSETIGGQTIRCPRCFALGWSEQPIEQRSGQGQTPKESGTGEEDSSKRPGDPDTVRSDDPEPPVEAIDWDAVQGFLKEEEVRKAERRRPTSTTGRSPQGTGAQSGGRARQPPGSTSGGSPEEPANKSGGARHPPRSATDESRQRPGNQGGGAVRPPTRSTSGGRRRGPGNRRRGYGLAVAVALGATVAVVGLVYNTNEDVKSGLDDFIGRRSGAPASPTETPIDIERQVQAAVATAQAPSSPATDVQATTQAANRPRPWRPCSQRPRESPPRSPRRLPLHQLRQQTRLQRQPPQRRRPPHPCRPPLRLRRLRRPTATPTVTPSPTSTATPTNSPTPDSDGDSDQHAHADSNAGTQGRAGSGGRCGD